MNNNNKVLICLVRHGKTNQNLKKLIQGRKDFPLSNIGRGEALQAAKILKETDPACGGCRELIQVILQKVIS